MHTIHTEHAPAAIGPYSQAIFNDGLLFTSGQIGLSPESGKIVAGGFEAQARQVLSNLKNVLSSAGSTPRDILRATIYLTNMKDFPVLNALYGEFLGSHRPARSTVQVAALPMGALVEIDLVARHQR